MKGRLPEYDKLIADAVALRIPGFNKGWNREVLRSSLIVMIREMREPLQTILDWRYGFNDYGEVLNLVQLGLKLGITSERVRQLEYKALRQLQLKIMKLVQSNYLDKIGTFT